MRPILLEIEAFGPYSDLQIIDFTMLKDVNMFLIHGPTGGGKTTILDAISYALYGDTSGNERDGESMRSHFAKQDVLTQVKLTFKIRDNTYYVHRIPGQERPKKVGEGTTYQSADAHLYKIQDNKKQLIASGVTKVRDEIINIIGFDSDQFRQVIMIPQGKFRQLLTARSEERQKILGDIFRTNKYKQVEEKIREEERELKKEIETLKERRKEQIKNIKYERSKELEEHIKSEYIDTVKVLDEMNKLFKEHDNLLDELNQKIELSKQNIIKKQEQLNEATNNLQKYSQMQKVKSEYNALKSKEEDYKDLEKATKLARKALPLKEIESYIFELKNQKDISKKELQEIIKEIESLQKKYTEIENEINSLKKEEQNIHQLRLHSYKLKDEYLPKVRELEELVTSKVELENKSKENKELKDKHILNLDKVKNTILENKKSIEEKEILNNKLRQIEIKEERLKSVVSNKKEQKRLSDQRNIMLRKDEELNGKISIKNEEYQKANRKHAEMVEMWIKSQTGELAKKLQSGKPCPVCGSLTHPNPALDSDFNITKEDVDKAQIYSNKIYDELIKLEKDKASNITEGKACRENLDRINELLNDYKDNTLDEIINIEKNNQKEKEDINKKLNTINNLEKTLKDFEDKKEQLEKEITKRDNNLIRYNENLVSININIEKIQKIIPEDMVSIELIENKIKNIEETILRYENKSDKTKESFEKISGTLQRTQGIKEEKQIQTNQLEEKYEKEVMLFKDKVELAGFNSFSEYKEAYKREEDILEIEKEIENYRNKLNILESNYKTLKQELENIKLQNIDELKDSYNKEKDLNERLLREHENIRLEKEHNKKQEEIISNSTKKIDEKERRYSVVGSLYDAVRGRNNMGLSFERFVQSALFEDILISANSRLVIMSNNRYELYRTDKRQTKASQAGLDMEVLDTYTGKLRNVNTLSGGEGFMASLSLALGLADVVQSYAGGIALDTIFIDEGFGTLDSQSLDLAISTLVDLQKNGRLVGIISHVPELKERIPARLEVENSQNGSSVKFHI